jgi:hypothetical protein
MESVKSSNSSGIKLIEFLRLSFLDPHAFGYKIEDLCQRESVKNSKQFHQHIPLDSQLFFTRPNPESVITLNDCLEFAELTETKNSRLLTYWATLSEIQKVTMVI